MISLPKWTKWGGVPKKNTIFIFSESPYSPPKWKKKKKKKKKRYLHIYNWVGKVQNLFVQKEWQTHNKNYMQNLA